MLLRLGGLLWLGMVCCSTSYGQSPIVRIEEDWELLVEQPDYHLDAPQVTVMMQPFGAEHPINFQVNVNHGTDPAFSSGGIQVRLCHHDSLVKHKRFLAGQRLSTAGELIRWTQVAQVVESGVLFGISSGHSETWGEFGGEQSTLFLPAGEAPSGSLNQYTVSSSLAGSGVTFAGNRVGYLRLSKVRFVNSLGQVSEVTVDTTVE